MKVIIQKKHKHMDYVDVGKVVELTVNSSKSCNERDLPCGQKSR